jgi:hypothetical protein
LALKKENEKDMDVFSGGREVQLRARKFFVE